MAKYNHLFSKTATPIRYHEFRPSDNENPQWDYNYKRAVEAIEQNGTIALIGGRGTGKTQASACLIGRTVLNHKKTALYTTAFEIFMAVRNGNNPNNNTTETREINKFTKPHLLVIDAYEVRGDTSFENKVLNHIIDHRYSAEKPTVIITNETIKTFAASTGESILDRMHESGGVIKFEYDSFRGIKK